MKNTSISKILLAATAVMFLFSACQKDTVTLKARFEQFNNGSKLHLSNQTSSWDEGDQIYIDGYWYEINGDGYISEVRASNRYVAYFVTPNTVTISDDAPAQFSIPAVQQYTVDGGVQKVFTPMYANSTNTTLSFKNMGAVLAIQLSNTSSFPNLTIDKIEITATNLLLWGVPSSTIPTPTPPRLVVSKATMTRHSTPSPSGLTTIPSPSQLVRLPQSMSAFLPCLATTSITDSLSKFIPIKAALG